MKRVLGLLCSALVFASVVTVRPTRADVSPAAAAFFASRSPSSPTYALRNALSKRISAGDLGAWVQMSRLDSPNAYPVGTRLYQYAIPCDMTPPQPAARCYRFVSAVGDARPVAPDAGTLLRSYLVTE